MHFLSLHQAKLSIITQGSLLLSLQELHFSIHQLSEPDVVPHVWWKAVYSICGSTENLMEIFFIMDNFFGRWTSSLQCNKFWRKAVLDKIAKQAVSDSRTPSCPSIQIDGALLPSLQTRFCLDRASLGCETEHRRDPPACWMLEQPVLWICSDWSFLLHVSSKKHGKTRPRQKTSGRDARRPTDEIRLSFEGLWSVLWVFVAAEKPS